MSDEPVTAEMERPALNELRELTRRMAAVSDRKIPTLAIYWADTRELLTHAERVELHRGAIVVSVTPREVLLETLDGRRLVAVCSVTDPGAPEVPR